MISRSILVTGALALFAAHCGGSSTPASNTPEAAAETKGGPDPTGSQQFGNETTAASGSDASGSTTTTLSDPQIAMITDKIHTAEIEQATIAQTKSSDDQVRRFAQMMIEHHGQAKAQQSALGLSSAESPMASQLERDSQATLETLKAKTGSDFDRAYLQAQVEGHQKALDTLEQLRPSAQNPDLRSYLDKLVPQVEQHLEKARAAQQALQASGARSPSGATGMR